jgi:hypothetical protein
VVIVGDGDAVVGAGVASVAVMSGGSVAAGAVD